MSACKKCGATLQKDWKVCPFCGKEIQATKHRGRKHINGQGWVRKRGKTYEATCTLGWTVDEHGNTKRVVKTKGGFATRLEAVEYIPKLRINAVIPQSTESFREIYERWCNSYDGRIAESTMKCYKAAFKWFKPVEHRIIGELTVAELQQCIDDCPRGRSTLDDMRTVCSLVFRFAIANQVVKDFNPAKHLYVAAKAKGTRAAFSHDEMELLKLSVGVVPYADYVVCMCYLGYRPTELLTLTKSQYHTSNGREWFVAGIKTKAGIDRTVPISPAISPIIHRQLQLPGDYLFPYSDGKMMNDEEFRVKCFEPLMAELGITGKVPYSCRHTFANGLKNVSGADKDKACLMGHTDISMTKAYQSAEDKNLFEIIGKLSL